MRTAGVLLITVLLGSIVPTATQQRPGGGESAAITAVADAYVKASLAGDVKGIVALYADDAVELPPNEPLVKGRAAIEQYYQKQFGSGKMATFTLTHLDTRASGDIAYDVGTYRQSLTPAGSTTPVNDSGKYTVILKRSAGAWKVAYAIYNSDQPPRR